MGTVASAAVRGADYPDRCEHLRDNGEMEKVIRVTTLAEQRAAGDADLAYWLARPVAKRIAAVETLRRQMNPSDAERDFKEFVGLLDANALEYLIVGGYALAAHVTSTTSSPTRSPPVGPRTSPISPACPSPIPV